jgi:hypothetical protein
MDIGWSVISPELDLLYNKPENLVSDVHKEYSRPDIISGDMAKCLGVVDLWGSVYKIKYPFDIRFKYDRDSRTILIDEKFTNINLDMLKRLLHEERDGTKNNPVLQLMMGMFFVSDKPCTVTLMPPIFELEKNPMWSKIRFVSAKMNIHSWQRDINFGFELLDKDAEITIKKGETVAYAIFNSENLDEKFTIKKVEFKDGLKKQYELCNKSRAMISKGTRYLVERALCRRPKKLVKEEGKCPYGFDKLKFW